jgi:S-methylmethionine-dependent homocysteine/selenocysteine methylase/SAM-dependent methyltransferase
MEPSSYQRIQHLLDSDQCVILDGATGTELPSTYSTGAPLDEELWGTRALIEDPDAVLDVHRRYARIGCDIVSTDTWGLPALLLDTAERHRSSPEPVHWMDVARRGVSLAREAVNAEGRAGRTAVAFSLNAAVDTSDGPDTVKLLRRVFEDEPPDLVLLETLSVVRPSLEAVIGELVGTGLPLWLSFRRCRHGLCSVYGQHWGGPEGDAFGRAARRFEDAGVGALLVNCIPPDHVDGMISYLRDFTDLPLGVYANLGYHSDHGWRSRTGVGSEEYAAMALRWRAEGAYIVGGCCGVGPDHMAVTRDALAGTSRGAETRGSASAAPTRPRAEIQPWTDRRDRTIYPLPVPELTLHPKVFAPTPGSLAVWRYLFDREIGAGQRCLDVGCGAGLQAIQLALNGAEHVHGIDREPTAVEYTLVNAFRNGVADRVSATTADLFAWLPSERYDVVVASLFQTPVDPMRHLVGHRPLDFWGRNLLDHLITMLPEALTPNGAAYLMQLSILSQRRTAELLAEHGLTGEVVDYGFFPMTEHFRGSYEQIEKVEAISDAHHLPLGDPATMVAYVLKVTR